MLRSLIRICIGIAALILVAGLSPRSAYAWTVETRSRTATEVLAQWDVLQPDWSGAAFDIPPSTAAPFAAGTLRPEFLDDGIDTVNFARYLAGLPADVSLSDYYSLRNQHAAVLNATNGRLDHFPARPADMSDAFYSLGREGAGSSNLAFGPTELERAVRLYLWDSDVSNIGHLGHRRWVLNPGLAKTGFGQAGYYSSMWAFDRSRTEPVSFRFIAWPAQGVFPTEFLPQGAAWSLTLDPTRYRVVASDLEIRMSRVSDGQSWTFTSADAIAAGRPFDGELLAYNTSGFGVPSCLIFRPPLDVAYTPGESFEVTVAAGVLEQGTSKPVTFSYRTDLFSLAQAPSRASAIGITAPFAVVYGTSNSLKARLAYESGEPLANKPVVFESSIDGGRTWKAVGASVTDSSGAAARVWTATGTRASMRMRARFPGDASISPSQKTVAVAVRPYITLSAPTTAVRARAFSVTGTLRPRHGVGTYPASVKCFRLIDGKWVYKASFRAKVTSNSTTTSTLRASVTLPAGSWRLKLYHGADTYHTSRYSAARSVTVR